MSLIETFPAGGTDGYLAIAEISEPAMREDIHAQMVNRIILPAKPKRRAESHFCGGGLMEVNRDSIGERGEAIVANLLTRRHRRPQPYFRPQFLGGKYPTIDFIVELLDADGPHTPFFLAQVKATSTGFNGRGQLKVRVPERVMTSLVKYPAPTYIIGVDEQDERAFIMAAIVGGIARIPSMPITHPLAKQQTLIALHEEVSDFWKRNPAVFTSSRFI